ncbi:MAG: hypothetical protein ACLPX7_15685, partial [Xanthobacteraceae bacterium]
MAGKIAPYIFTVVIPVVVAAMLPHIGLEIGLPIILFSIVVGLADFAWVYSTKRHGKAKLGPILMMAAGALLLGGGAIWFFLSPSRLHNSQEAHDLPTIKLAFIPETLKDDDIVFHLTATNANPATIRISRVSYTTGQMSDVEIEKNNKRIVPSGGAIDYPGLPFTGLAKSKRLAVQIEFEYDPHQKA